MEGKCVKGLTLKCILQSFLEGKKSYNSAAAFLIMRIVVSGKGNMLREIYRRINWRRSGGGGLGQAMREEGVCLFVCLLCFSMSVCWFVCF